MSHLTFDVRYENIPIGSIVDYVTVDYDSGVEYWKIAAATVDVETDTTFIIHNIVDYERMRLSKQFVRPSKLPVTISELVEL